MDQSGLMGRHDRPLHPLAHHSGDLPRLREPQANLLAACAWRWLHDEIEAFLDGKL